jgi:membrane peptidoglycan carboxypeptidase
MAMRKRKKKTKIRKLWGFLKFQMVLILIVVAAVTYYYTSGYAAEISGMKEEAVRLVAASTVETFRQSQTSIAYDANGEVLSVLKGAKDVYYISYEDIPIYIKQAMISTEDRRFYKHHGIDYRGILRAAYAAIQDREITQGGSTITQQLARTVFLSNERTWQRKVEEMYIAVELEKKYTKEEILEFYLNNVYFANGYYGIEAARDTSVRT